MALVQNQPVQACRVCRRRVRRPSVPGNALQGQSCRVCTLCHAIPIGRRGDNKWQWLSVEGDGRNYNFGFFGESEPKH